MNDKVKFMADNSNEVQIRMLIENWAKAVRERNIDAILAQHSKDIVMFDLPPPFQSIGIDAYKKTWDQFFVWTKDSGVFDILEMKIIAGLDVSFCYASMQCAGYDEAGEKEEFQFRLTIGLEKKADQWMVIHEHHSLPSK